MKNKFLTIFLSFSIFLVSFLFLNPQQIFAASYTLDGTVRNAVGNNIVGASIVVSDSVTGASAGTATTDSNGFYTLLLLEGTYNVQVTPPAGSGYTTSIAFNQTISTNKTLNFTLTPSGTVTISGKLVDASGNIVPNAFLSVEPQSGASTSMSTDSSGNYTFTGAPGIYTFDFGQQPTAPSSNLPRSFQVTFTKNFTASATNFNITVPAKQITVHIHNNSNAGVAGVQVELRDGANRGSASLGSGITNGTTVSRYLVSMGNIPLTDANGDAVLWITPNDQNNLYKLVAIPPSGSQYGSTTLSNVNISNTTTTVDITLNQQITISGKLKDTAGNPVPNAFLSIEPQAGTSTSTATDSSGNYTFTGAPGTYTFDFGQQPTNPLSNLPRSFQVTFTKNFTASVSNFDITVPAKQITVHVHDSANNGVSGIQVEVWDGANRGFADIGSGITNGTTVSRYILFMGNIPSTDSNGNVTLWITPNDQNNLYRLVAKTPSGSIYDQTTLSNVNITNTTTNVDITLNQSITIAGKLVDDSGNPVPSANLTIQPPAGSNTITSTDAAGNYSFTGAPGAYTFDFGKQPTAPTSHLPQSFQTYFTKNFTASVSNFNITVPAKQVTVRVQDSFNVGIPGVKIEVSDGANRGFADLGSNITNGTTVSRYLLSIGALPATDQNGEVVLWITPNDQNNLYKFVAIPPSGSPYAQFVLNNVSVIGNQTEIISLQYNHDAPLTTATLETEQADNTYSDPTTVTLSATAANGYTVANTYYKIDNGSQQTYTAPFTVSGSGPHHIEYWSVDNSGVQEAHKTKDFTIATQYEVAGTVFKDKNENGVQDTGEAGYDNATVQLSNGQSTTTNANGAYTISNVVGGTYSVILSVPQGDFATTPNPQTNVSVGPSVDDIDFGIATPHTRPTTTVTLSPNAVNGEYPKPVTVTLNATPSAGYTISHTYYQLDGNQSQEYTGPFTVSTAGQHTISYWSVDEAGYGDDPIPSTDFTISSTITDGYIDPSSGAVNLGNGITISGTVISGGYVTVVPSSNNKGGPIPSTFKILNTFYNITSTATFTGPITLTFDYPTNNPNQNLKVLHYNGSSWDQLPTTQSYNAQTQIMTLTVTTPSLSPFAIVELHEQAPVTTAELATQRPDGTYNNPTTVTLSATAEEGYTVDSTYYKVDGGTQQTYTEPFTVSGSGEHTLVYWSVDNSGLEETQKTQTFTIYLNQAPDVDPFPGTTINRGQTFTATSSFTDPDSSSWSATVDYDEGAGDEPLTLNPDKTFSLSHQYNTEGTYQVRVVVRDAEQATGTVLATVTVIVPEPVTTTFNSSSDTYVKSGSDNRNTGTGTFMRLQSSGNNRGLVQFDQTAMQSQIGNKQVLSATLRVTITDNGNNWGTTGRTIDLHRLLVNWTEGNGTESSRGTGAGSTWECATDTNVTNTVKDCTGSAVWEMGQPNNPAVHPWAQSATATKTITNNQSGVVEFDVTSDTVAFLDGTNQNYGWIIKKTDEGQTGQVSFGTKESASVPQLVVTYQP